MKFTTTEINTIHTELESQIKKENTKVDIVKRCFEVQEDSDFRLLVCIQYMTPEKGFQLIGRYI